ncbi:MAG: hypothetical protein UU48_C0004G0042 [Candidatus Uhrbacteria bacterium GW2011_GWF2_41_16]|jgi:hypothetical protein|uniref:Response regulatory domain-containing protein n=2 Tax=Candidatus Uhriibacteriota TaxID=1752732 RepID=A0A0G0VBI4_9BACT|nr:MAG: hypothetical protein UU35_C0013G0014 [Candidatus Uhrbacteria bacterium GW2011_GWC2_41_11]KKR98249.1 MAG: hypothetical protein UU48_C0004G0042 [Candidatus Uhrbacteria bacterium GW2011_GWF2_41_16]HBO99836.1 hypothetical protein [Candidatus Uhrbacteria bacterium]
MTKKALVVGDVNYKWIGDFIDHLGGEAIFVEDEQTARKELEDFVSLKHIFHMIIITSLWLPVVSITELMNWKDDDPRLELDSRETGLRLCQHMSELGILQKIPVLFIGSEIIDTEEIRKKLKLMGIQYIPDTH